MAPTRSRWTSNHYRSRPSGELSLLARVEQNLDNRLNDGRVDARGRFWVGTMDNQLHRPNGALYRVDPDGAVHKFLGGVIVSNGIAFSPDDTTMYFTDTRRHLSWQFDFDLDAGRLSNQRLFADYGRSGDRPMAPVSTSTAPSDRVLRRQACRAPSARRCDRSRAALRSRIRLRRWRK
jgi:sugar lactone lactonase YvrE